jgi:hypothetical protein
VKKFGMVLAGIAIVFATMACSLNILPFTTTINVERIQTGPTVTEEISVPVPTDQVELRVELLFGLGKLKLEPGDAETLIDGTVRYNVEELKPTVVQEGDTVRLVQGDEERGEGFSITVPDLPLDLEIEGHVESEWDLRIGSVPMALTIHTGAMESELELGGLSLSELDISQGVSNFELSFSKPNQTVMERMQFNAGASTAVLNGLSNANAEVITFKGGAGSYRLDFSGELTRDVRVRLEAGVGEVVILVPEGVSAEARLEGALTDVDAFGAWQRSGDKVILDGSGPEILFDITMGLGNLEFRTR